MSMFFLDIPSVSPWFTTSGGQLQYRVQYRFGRPEGGGRRISWLNGVVTLVLCAVHGKIETKKILI